MGGRFEGKEGEDIGMHAFEIGDGVLGLEGVEGGDAELLKGGGEVGDDVGDLLFGDAFNHGNKKNKKYQKIKHIKYRL